MFLLTFDILIIVLQGVLWALAILYTFHEQNVELYHKVITTNYYSNNQAIELAVHGCISMLLTVVNIICILLMGVLVLKVLLDFFFSNFRCFK